MKQSKSRSTNPELYDEHYFLSHCNGYKEFLKYKGLKLPWRLRNAIILAKIKPGMKILDVGCGRGEVVLHYSQNKVTSIGLDYSSSALKIAKEADNCTKYTFLLRADAKFLPFRGELFDGIFLLDVVEHLYPEELRKCLCEVFYALKPSGRVIIHTNPNLWRKYILPIKKIMGLLLGIKVSEKDMITKQLHVNEQSPLSLKKKIRECGFEFKVWVEASELLAVMNRLPRMKSLFVLLTRSPIVLFGNDIWTLAWKT